MRPIHVAVAVALLAVPLTGCLGSDPGAPLSGESVSWSFVDTDGVEHSNDTAAGSPTVVFFMATWCASCQEKTEDMRAVHEAYEPHGVDVFSVTVDPNEDVEDLEAWKQTYQQPWPHGTDPELAMAQTFGVQQTSNVVVLDGDNQLVTHWGFGQANEAAMTSILDDLLG